MLSGAVRRKAGSEAPRPPSVTSRGADENSGPMGPWTYAAVPIAPTSDAATSAASIDHVLRPMTVMLPMPTVTGRRA